VGCAGVRCCFYYLFIMLVVWLFGRLLYLMLVCVRGYCFGFGYYACPLHVLLFAVL